MLLWNVEFIQAERNETHSYLRSITTGSCTEIVWILMVFYHPGYYGAVPDRFNCSFLYARRFTVQNTFPPEPLLSEDFSRRIQE